MLYVFTDQAIYNATILNHCKFPTASACLGQKPLLSRYHSLYDWRFESISNVDV